MSKLFARIVSVFPAREEGQGLVEYAVVLGVIVVALIGIWNVSGVQNGVTNALNAIAAALP